MIYEDTNEKVTSNDVTCWGLRYSPLRVRLTNPNNYVKLIQKVEADLRTLGEGVCFTMETEDKDNMGYIYIMFFNKATKDADVAINQINDLDFEELNKTVAKLSEAAGQMNTVAGQLNTTAATLNKTVSKTSGEVDDTMEAIGNIDFEGFNRSIKSLSQAAEDLQETASGIKKVTSTFIGGKSTGKTEKKSSK